MDGSAHFRRIARNASLGAAALTFLLFVVWLLVFHVPYVQHLDASVFDGFSGLRDRPHVSRLADLIATSCDPSQYVYLAIIPVAIAVFRRRMLLAAAVLGILGAANLTTEILKPLLAEPRPHGLPPWVISQASWPSGHATASMTLALCVVLASPGRYRPYAAALGAAFAVAVMYSFLTLGWHYPSDALAGFLMASIWTLVGIAVIARIEARRTHGRAGRPPELEPATALRPPALVLAAVLTTAAFVVAVRPDAVLSYARFHAAFVVGAAALGALGLVLATGVMMTIRR